jgi:nucleoside-diphosphate-sugar epimerase
VGGSGPRDETAPRLTSPAIILGLGFTGRRVAKRLLVRGGNVFAFARNPERFSDLASIGLRLISFDATPPPNGNLLHTVPPLTGDDQARVLGAIARSAPRRIAYISSTGVYGDAAEVDETTAPNPSDDRGRRRLEEETRVSTLAPEAFILRAAAIYGPGRGVHVAIREGRLPRSAGSGIVSRIHVEDLAALSEAAMLSEATGAWPVADDAPCASSEIAQFLRRERLTGDLPPIEIKGRKVNGRAIRDLLQVNLAYPDWKSGILASLAEEAALTRRPG